MLEYTMKEMVERAIKDEIPEIEEVQMWRTNGRYSYKN